MPGVVFGPAPRYDYWGAALADLLGNVGGNLVKGMFDRDAAANQYRLTNRLADDANARALKHSRDKIALYDEIMASDPDGFVRGQESQNMRSHGRLMAGFDNDYGKNTTEAYKTFVPQAQHNYIDAGDQLYEETFIPDSGITTQGRTIAKAVSPDINRQATAQELVALRNLQGSQAVAGAHIKASENTLEGQRLRNASEHAIKMMELADNDKTRNMPTFTAPFQDHTGELGVVNTKDATYKPLGIGPYRPAVPPAPPTKEENELILSEGTPEALRDRLSRSLLNRYPNAPTQSYDALQVALDEAKNSGPVANIRAIEEQIANEYPNGAPAPQAPVKNPLASNEYDNALKTFNLFNQADQDPTGFIKNSVLKDRQSMMQAIATLTSMFPEKYGNMDAQDILAGLENDPQVQQDLIRGVTY